MVSLIAASAILLLSKAAAQQPAYAQCGGVGFSGDTACVSGYTCSILNDYYSQCVPGAAATTTSATTATSTTGTSTTATSGTTSGASSTSSVPVVTATGSDPYPTTLLADYYWIRAVESPNYHSYLQAAPTATPYPGSGDAYLLTASAAGQFNVVSGQLVFYMPSSEPLYMGVENSANKTQRTLATWFNSTENSYGTFAFSGDALTWTVDDIDRPNEAAWYVCGDEGRLYINTGAYAYDTPDGCVDETIHYYGGSTADV
ncbi:hypothetical protein F5Y15DRAFT_320730 [Xylariaceae sp. FL0016]|nr:hypothetical protein F5Y15DRAFT_320730 [Xylariaceae sp. FL0016]